MNYRHHYHAGNFADVMKHIILIELINSLQKKDAPICYLDSHSGRGFYDLEAPEALKTEESNFGIKQLKRLKEVPGDISNYLNLVSKFSESRGANSYYPGSPNIVKILMRPQDRMILNELHSEEVSCLKSEFKRDKQVNIHSQDAYLLIPGIIPPKEKRGLVFIDPPFENKSEFSDLINLLKQSLKRWETGVYAIWYPITRQGGAPKFLKDLNNLGVSDILNLQLSIYEDDSPAGLNGSGVVILNPPWKLDEKFKEILPFLSKNLGGVDSGSYRVELL